MAKVIPHGKTRKPRYLVQRNGHGGCWFDYSWHHSLWRAKRVARYREGLGWFDYRVVDTREEE